MSIFREMRRSQESEPFYCQECRLEKRKGYKMAFGIDSTGYSWPSFHICDECLKGAI
jgi:hypothetical protein